MSAADSSPPAERSPAAGTGQRAPLWLVALFLATALGGAGIAYLLVTIFEHQQDARQPHLRVAELTEVSTDPVPWGMNWPHHLDHYKRTAGDKFHGGSEALPESKLDQHPWLQRLYAGYAFSIDYREARGHAYMLYDQVVTERVNQRPQAAACLHCHSSPTVLYRKVGLEAFGEPTDEATLAAEFNMPAVIKGFELLSTRPYHDVLLMLAEMPDGSLTGERLFPSPPLGGFDRDDLPEEVADAVDGIPAERLADIHAALDGAHPISCIDCHDPATMQVRITRPGFMQGIADLAASDGPLPQMPSIDAWRRGDRSAPYDPNALASRREMRTFVCAQCHVEYYCATRDTLEYPWKYGLKVEQMERRWEEKRFPDGDPFVDYEHAETGAPLFKAQHPEFELWAQGTHARAGVGCADCHMAYQRVGAMKLSNHDVRSPLHNLNNACQVCHQVDQDELLARVQQTQQRTADLMELAAAAMTEMLDAILEAKQAGVEGEPLQELYRLQRKSMWRLDFISSENSKGFHAPQESARVLGESIDYSRRAQALALRSILLASGEVAAAVDGEVEP